ncbi:TPA: dipeptide epimerase [Candidatus Poribacteria bacterium]|jgi:L-alanine-DL-glutamate epimerase-like enolase superfamily enzyme|nr:dipeptide epimerase [Candidatus Poribacteria bacterium]HIB91095.1 dipeptide epimerase [Candidatus Poribacteria bacterium]HIC01111.1 dipeptide epimerase [Candidatus Poribacteria bacterium]HIM09214.1 dipeptide epimerase [Candidatus Poribacteria bacterium]HIN31505.1 dipeptide epimerase [Candidatus Poribacteria bacterium]
MSIHHSIIELELTHPFKISRRATDFFRQAITVEIDGGIGAASPTRFYGETIETVQHAFDSFTPIIDQAEDLDAIQSIMSEVDETLSGNYAAKSAIDLALHDRLAKRLGIPLFKLWGVDPNQALDTSFTIGLDEPEIMQQKVIQASDFPILKVKLGTDRDLEIIGAIREVTDKPIYVDANTAWSPKEAVSKIRQLEPFKIALIEQPTKAEDLLGLKFIREHSNLPIFADESVNRSNGIPRLAGVVDGINIKLSKCGGLLEAIRMIHVARSHNLQIMIGCMIESSISITAAAHLTPLVDYADLDGHLLVSNDPYNGVTLDQGKLVLPDQPGIGVMKRHD